MSLSKEELLDLRYAKSLLEDPSLATKITGMLGIPIEKGFDLLPDGWRTRVSTAVRVSLERALDAAVFSIRASRERRSFDLAHKIAVGATGAAGGAFGLSALAIELPVSTSIMLRSVAAIAGSEGHDVTDLRTRLDCLEVFALGAPSAADDAAESGYFAARAALSQVVADAGRYVAQHGLAAKNAPALVRLISAIAGRFGIVVSEKAAAQAVPVIGAAGGALSNTLFIDHFQDVAHGHFIIRRLDRIHGEEAVRAEYERL
ncbi:MAG: EcsC family protein [Myxococcales bacterium]|nr:MAG: EcsC family protein [Myxococcales bacterium]